MRTTSLALFAALAATAVCPAPAWAGSFFGDAIEIQILREQVHQGILVEQQLAAIRSGLATARENLTFVRSVYGGVNDFMHFNATTFAQEAKDYFLMNNPTIGDSAAFADDVVRRGMRGSFNPYPVNAQIDQYFLAECERRRSEARQLGFELTDCMDQEEFRRRKTERALPVTVAASGQSVADVYETMLSNRRIRDRMALEVRPAGPSDGLLYADTGRVDPAITSALLHESARSRMVEEQSMRMYIESLDQARPPSPGKLAQIGAASSAATAASVARLEEIQARQQARADARAAEEHAEAERLRQERAIRAYTFGRLLRNSITAGAPVPSREEAPATSSGAPSGSVPTM